MKFKWSFVFFAFIFLLASASAFLFEGSYCSFVKQLYISFTNGKLHFIGGKTFHFPSYSFIFSFGTFCTLVVFKLIWPINISFLVRLIISIAFFFMVVIELSNIESVLLLAQCTACNDGTRSINLGEISLNGIFIVSLAFAYLPFILFNKPRTKPIQPHGVF
jgi:hypothetical protein